MLDQQANTCLRGFWTGRVNCTLCKASSMMPFRQIGGATNGAPDLRAAESYALPSGAMVANAGDPAAAVFSIRAGFIKLWRLDDAGQCRIVRLLGPGDMLGLEATFQPVYQLNAATLSACELCRIPIQLLTRVEQGQPAVYHEVERRWHIQLQQADELAISVVTGPSRERVLRLLRYLAQFAAPDPCPRIRRLDMAAILDIAPETAARVIADLKKAGVLEETPTELRFDPARLPLGGSALQQSKKMAAGLTAVSIAPPGRSTPS